jgi:flagellar hook-basal body complex protein FliE
MSDMNINQVLSQIRVLSQRNLVSETPVTKQTNFSELLADSINNVNSVQQQASALKTAYELGDPDVDLPEVMIAGQKAALSFEAMTEVRNKLLNAYQEIMNMQV